MRTLGPLILGVFAGWIAFGELYIPHPDYRWLFELFRDYAQILAAVAFILGALNLIQVNYPKIRRRQADWQFKVIMLAGAALMGLVGIQWHTFGGERSSGTTSAMSSQALAVPDKAVVVFDAANKEALVSIDGKKPLRAWHSGDPSKVWSAAGDTALSVELAPGEHEIKVFMPVSGYRELRANETLAAGSVLAIKTDLVMMWGAGAPEGRVFTWFYDHVFFPCNATMFALLAFFIASAAFRAFRARNVESALLLGAAILVMIGLVPVGRVISPIFPEIADWILEIPNNAGRRAIMMGAALGGIVTGLRVILGLERSHLGSES